MYYSQVWPDSYMFHIGEMSFTPPKTSVSTQCTCRPDSCLYSIGQTYSVGQTRTFSVGQTPVHSVVSGPVHAPYL